MRRMVWKTSRKNVMEPMQLPQNSEECLSPAEVTRRQRRISYRAEMTPMIARLCWSMNDDDFADLVRYVLSMGERLADE
jgi:hypothetical protein